MKAIKGIGRGIGALLDLVVGAIVYAIAVLAGFATGPVISTYAPEVYEHMERIAVNVIAVVYDSDAFAAVGALVQVPYLVNTFVGVSVAVLIVAVYSDLTK